MAKSEVEISEIAVRKQLILWLQCNLEDTNGDGFVVYKPNMVGNS